MVQYVETGGAEMKRRNVSCTIIISIDSWHFQQIPEVFQKGNHHIYTNSTFLPVDISAIWSYFFPNQTILTY